MLLYEHHFNTSVLTPLQGPDYEIIDQSLATNLPASAYAFNSFRINRQHFKDSTLFLRCSFSEPNSGFILLAYKHRERDEILVVTFCPETEIDIWRKVVSEGFLWSSPILFCACTVTMKAVIDEIPNMTILSLTPNNQPISVYICESMNDLKDVSCSPGICIGYLKVADSEKIFNSWPYRSTASLEIVKETIEVGFGVGARVSGSDELVSWCIQYRSGSQGSLGTVPEHKRKGFAKSIAREMARQTLEAQLVPVSGVVWGNDASGQLYESLGYKKATQNCRFSVSKILTLNRIEAHS